MKTIYVILGALITLSTLSFGQSRKDVEDFKVKFPKTERALYYKIENIICSYKKPHILTRETPFVMDIVPKQYSFDYWEMTLRYADKRFTVRDWITLSEPSWEKDVPQYQEKDYKRQRAATIGRRPRTWKDATHKLPSGTVVFNVWFFAFDDPEFDKLGSFRTSSVGKPIRNIERLPIRFRNLYEKVSVHEEKKVRDFMKRRIKIGYAYGVVEINDKEVFGWMPIQAILSAKRRKEDYPFYEKQQRRLKRF